ncbi:hypothetical protein VOLCADRAFT_108479 [Volvox carteri f. nagariensis]|uniref:Uncharacterized protein n=1 Tax=Volvox carteri f. nagariensis TaxID=3068 RepID=D8UKD2_VOLCA|nr:uncharacterized protein VOLCADRAFT_108479 [Volvox carteri f. nagariensis]EFJ39815.1 hypothetical protein VOLCADRAFT_108479 [Volvox carteri f. nagariensis]|eukprot:XP_002959116.1 hypothetical protein VOLCADRAFT_108479 [Volvox carteri f. nagariensis]
MMQPTNDKQITQSVTMFPFLGLEVALVAMFAGIVMMPAKRRVGDQVVELQKVLADLHAQLTAIEQADDYQKAASMLASDPLARLNKKKFSTAMGHAWDTYVALKSQMASVSAHIAQLEMTMEQPAMKVLVSDKSGRVMERPLKDLDYVNDGWVNKSGKEHKALKRENRELNQIYHALQKVNRNLEDEREARRDEAPPEQIEELEKATNDAITEDAFAASFWERAGRLVAPSHLGLLAESQAFAASSRAASTKKVYTYPWEGFKSWCRAGGYCYLPASPVVVGMYLTSVAKTASSYASVKLASAAIFMQHDLACEGANPTKHPFCKAVAGVGSAGFLPEPVEVARSAGNPSRVTGTDREPVPSHPNRRLLKFSVTRLASSHGSKCTLLLAGTQALLTSISGTQALLTSISGKATTHENTARRVSGRLKQ